ncbi:MAG: sigma-E factor negative regulatory protein [Burkholderiales bacterium]
MKERLSALIDGELSGEEFGRHVGRLGSDAGLRNAWDAYHLIGDALRGDISAEIASRVVARLRDEPTVLAPRRAAVSFRRLSWYAMSAAASVAAITLVVWTAAPLWRDEPQLAATPAAVTVGSEGAPLVPVTSADARQAAPVGEVENYLLAHQPYSHTSAMQGIAPYVRTIADDIRSTEK